MNRDFEIRQLLRAFRSGIMSEAAFEEEMARLEHEALGSVGGENAGFEAFGQLYRSEREAVMSFLTSCTPPRWTPRSVLPSGRLLAEPPACVSP
jgi:hypothetical protein